MYEDQPVGDICVLRDPQGETWAVSICRGLASPMLLGRFNSLEKATEFAFAERDRLRVSEKREVTVHRPDDCPCYRTYRS
ncbi:MAG TPA: hypothetical protein VHP11_08650 [Tepidisphaeraceae bacterium]|nr:hypothetical protein [Tepidisphaeraceae bacterium]